MAMKLSVGLSKKLGQPDFGSIGASCHVEVELDSNLFHQSPEELVRKTQHAFHACRQAVQAELTREQTGGAYLSGPTTHPESSNTVILDDRPNAPTTPLRKATTGQIKAIHSIADRQKADLPNVLYKRFGIYQLAELNIRQASHLIDELKGMGGGDHR